MKRLLILLAALALYGCNRPDPARVATSLSKPPDIGEYAEDAAGVADRVQGGADAILGHTGTVRRAVRADAAIAAAAEPPLSAIDHEATSLAGETVRLRVLAEQLTETQLQVRRLGEALEAETARADDLAATAQSERLAWMKTAATGAGLGGTALAALGLVALLAFRRGEGAGAALAGVAMIALAVTLAAVGAAVSVVIFWARIGAALFCVAALGYGLYYLAQFVRNRRALVGVVKSVDAAKATLGASGEPARESLNAALAANQEPAVRAAVAEIRGGAA